MISCSKNVDISIKVFLFLATFLKGLVLCPPTYINTSGSVLVHQLVAYFVCLRFVAGQVVVVVFFVLFR